MLTWLSDILEVLLHLPTYILYAVEELINLVLEGFQVLMNNAAALLPEIPSVVPPPEFVETMNWFVPIGGLVIVLGNVVAAYVVFLAVRWLWQRFGAL